MAVKKDKNRSQQVPMDLSDPIVISDFPNLDNEKFVVIDTETTGLDIYGKSKIFAFCVGVKDREWYFPIRQHGGINYDEQNTLAFIKDICNDPKKVIIMANSSFDLAMLRKEGIEVTGQVADVFAAASIFDNRYTKTGLKELARRAGFDTIEETVKDDYVKKYKISDWSYMPNSIMMPYGLMDARITYDLLMYYLNSFNSDELRLFNLESRISKIIFEMIWYGLRIDWDYTYSLGEELSAEMQLISLQLMKHGIEPSKSETIIPFIERENLPIINKTPTGLVSTDHDSIVAYNHPVLNKVIDYRTVSKLYTTYVLNFINDNRNGIVHPKIWQNGTVTGRFSSNFQQLPKDDKRIKRSIIPREGNLLWLVDIKQMEYRVFAALANDESIIKQFAENPNMDFHQMMADRLGVSRQIAKTSNFAILYGAGAARLAEMLGITLQEAYNILDKYYDDVPAIKIMRDKLGADLKNHGYIRTPSGRKYYVEYDSVYKAPNYFVQGYCSDMIRYSMCKIYDDFKSDSSINLLLQIHDELVGESPIDKMPMSINMVTKRMEGFSSLSIPILSEPSYGRNMGDKVEWNLEEFEQEYGK